MTIVNSIINWINYKRIYEIDLYREHAMEIQEEVLFNLLNTAKNARNGGNNTIMQVSDHGKISKINVPG